MGRRLCYNVVISSDGNPITEDNKMTSIEVLVSNRKVSLPLIGDINRGSEETLTIEQVEPSDDVAETMEKCYNLFEDAADFVAACNAGAVEVARKAWFDENSVEVADGSGLSTIRDLLKTYGNMGIGEEDAMRMIAKIPNVYASAKIDGIDLSKALTETEVSALESQFPAAEKVVLAQREKIAEAKANSKRGRPRKVAA